MKWIDSTELRSWANSTNEFRIVEEQSFDYGGENHLYLMLIKYLGNYYIVADTRSMRKGSRKVRSRKEADVVFSQMEKRLIEFNNLEEACEVLNHAYKRATIREHMFLVNNLNTEVDFNHICKMKRIYGCVITPVNTDLIFEDRSYEHTIYITFPNQRESLGYFKAPDQDSSFRFNLNPEFY